jgi:GNAT superfamily N-acetyltransferase
METLRIRRAEAADGERLREITAVAKALWDYDPQPVAVWAAQLDFSATALAARETHVAEQGDRIVAYAALVQKGETVILDDLWVDPSSIGEGIGARLFTVALERVRELRAKRLEWESEPNAVGFYEKMGGRWLRDSEPSSWGRILPVMAIDLETD